MDDDQLLAAVLKRFFEDPDDYVYLRHHEAQDAWYLTIDAGIAISEEEGRALQRVKSSAALVAESESTPSTRQPTTL